eukprot:scaffold8106_cov107-Isochrysis_galbana.AAC.6
MSGIMCQTFLATGQHGAAELRVGPYGRLSGRSAVEAAQTFRLDGRPGGRVGGRRIGRSGSIAAREHAPWPGHLAGCSMLTYIAGRGACGARPDPRDGRMGEQHAWCKAHLECRQQRWGGGDKAAASPPLCEVDETAMPMHIQHRPLAVVVHAAMCPSLRIRRPE